MSEYITPKVSIPQRNLSHELSAIYNADLKYAPDYYNLESIYGPKYNELNLQNIGEQQTGYTDANGQHVPGLQELGRSATQAQRLQDISDVESMGPRAVAADLRANPFLARSLGLLSNAQTDKPLLDTLNQQAESALSSGGALSPEDERAVRESTRSTFSDLGLGNTDQAGIAELFNRDAAKRGRLAAAQQFAGSVEGLNNTFRDFLGRSTQIDATALNDPFMSVLSRSGGQGGGGAGITPIGQYTRVFDPFNPYAQDLFSSNQNAAATQAIGNAQAQAATRAAIASIAGSAIKSDIRAKEKIQEIGTIEISNGKIVPLYEFEYRAGCVPKGLRPVRYRGVMADDIERAMPEAIAATDANGFKLVNYDMLGIKMEEAA